MQVSPSVRRSFATALVGGLVLLASACGSDGKAASPTTAVDTTAVETTAAETTAPETTAVETTIVDTTAGTDTTLIDATGTRPDDAIAYEDPQGLYSMDISPSWVDSTGTLGPEIEFFQVQPTGSDFANNVTVIDQPADGRDLDEYLAFSLENMGTMEVLDSGKIIGVNGNTLGYLEYSGTTAVTGDLPLHFLAVFTVKDDHVSLITMGATEDTFSDVADANAAYLLGLQPL